MDKLRIHTLMHVPFEGLGCMEEWISKHNHLLSYTKLYESATLPNINEIDWLIVMGGPMGVYDEAIYDWLTAEKTFVRNAIEQGKTVLGICLGSQLIAEVLGAKVYPNTQKEIGWFDLKLTEDGKTNSLLGGFEACFPVFHWHGDTFDLPEGSKRLFYSDVTPNQAFIYKEKVLGLQFHFEVTEQSMSAMVQHGADELIPAATIQSADEILAETSYIASNNAKMFSILDALAKQ